MEKLSDTNQLVINQKSMISISPIMAMSVKIIVYFKKVVKIKETSSEKCEKEK